MTTKEQERKALEQIRKIVEGLGEDSYVAAAFEGCFEIAEDNIEFDWGCSMKQNVEAAEKKEALATKLLEQKTQAAKDMGKALQDAYDRINELSKELAEAKEKQLGRELFDSIWEMAYFTHMAAENVMMQHADTMADLAEKPTDIAFQNAAKNYKHCKEKASKTEWIMQELDRIKPKGC